MITVDEILTAFQEGSLGDEQSITTLALRHQLIRDEIARLQRVHGFWLDYEAGKMDLLLRAEEAYAEIVDALFLDRFPVDEILKAWRAGAWTERSNAFWRVAAKYRLQRAAEDLAAFGPNHGPFPADVYRARMEDLTNCYYHIDNLAQ